MCRTFLLLVKCLVTHANTSSTYRLRHRLVANHTFPLHRLANLQSALSIWRCVISHQISGINRPADWRRKCKNGSICQIIRKELKFASESLTWSNAFNFSHLNAVWIAVGMVCPLRCKYSTNGTPNTLLSAMSEGITNKFDWNYAIDILCDCERTFIIRRFNLFNEFW